MSQARGFVDSTIGRKVIMAVTGAILFGFVLVHMVGNLQVYLGPEAHQPLRRLPARVPPRRRASGSPARSCSSRSSCTSGPPTSLTLTSRRARPEGYRLEKWKESTYASRTMRWGGVILLLFIVYHLLHFTTGTVHQSFIEGDVYHNFVAGFRNVWVAAFYIVAMLALGLHLRHGVWSMFQTLGVSHPRYIRMAHVAAWIFAAIVVIGNISFPLAVLAGIVR